MAYEYYTNPSYQQQQAVVSLPAIAYQNLRDELTLITRAESDLGVTVDQSEIDKQLRAQVGVSEDADDSEFADKYRSALSASHLKDGEYRRVARAQVLENKAKDKLNESTPAQVPMAKLEVITANDEATVQRAIDAVKAGAPWADVAAIASLEPEAKTAGGVKDYNFETAMPKAYATFAFSAPIGEISAPLQDPSGAGPFYAVRVVDRQDRDLTEDQKSSYQSRQYRRWLEDTQGTMNIVDKWTTDDKAQVSALNPLLDDLKKKLDAQRRQQNRPQPTIALPTSAPTGEGTPAGETPVATAPANGQ
jgi:parvulin-like peptidyl-prolyl isomerase